MRRIFVCCGMILGLILASSSFAQASSDSSYCLNFNGQYYPLWYPQELTGITTNLELMAPQSNMVSFALKGIYKPGFCDSISSGDCIGDQKLCAINPNESKTITFKNSQGSVTLDFSKVVAMAFDGVAQCRPKATGLAICVYTMDSDCKLQEYFELVKCPASIKKRGS